MKKYLLFVAVIGLMASCSADKAEEKTPGELKAQNDKLAADQKKIQDELAAQEAELYSWQYDESKDEMSDKTTYNATILSRDIAMLDFPYEGGTTMKLFIRNKGGQQDAFIRCENGQITDDYDNRTLTIRFDDEPAVRYEVLESADGDSEFRFIYAANKFIKKLKTAKKVKIQVQFYNNGTHIYNFDTEGLKW